MIIRKITTGLMSHKGNDIFRESLREAKVEKIYDALNGTETVQEVKLPPTCLPPNEDEDYWQERQEQADHLREVYYEAQKYRDL